MKQSEFMRRMMRLEYALYARDSAYDKKDGFPGLLSHLAVQGVLREQSVEDLLVLWALRNRVAGTPPQQSVLPDHIEELLAKAEAILTQA